MVQIVLLTGFLGAGKTTLMQRLLDTYAGRKIGVIINEFGEINIDAKLVSRDGIEMAELSNGSIFCACIKDKFVDGLIAMSKTDIEYLFIEASGLADPSNMGEIVSGIRRETDDQSDDQGCDLRRGRRQLSGACGGASGAGTTGQTRQCRHR